MKKLFSLCLMSMAAATMAAEEVPFTVTPADGSTVENFNSMVFELKEDSGFAAMGVNSFEPEDIYFTCNGEMYCGIGKVWGEMNPLEIIPLVPITTPGEYALVIKPYAISWYNSEFFAYDNQEELTYSFTFGNGAGEDPYEGLPFTTEPEEGATVSSLTYVLLNLKEDAPYTHFEVNAFEDSDDIYFAYSGEYYCKGFTNPAGRTLEVYPEASLDLPGEWQLVIKPYAIAWADDEYNHFSDNLEEIVLSYTVEEPSLDDYPFTVTPAPGSMVEELGSFEISLKPETGYTWLDINSDEIYILKDNAPVEGVTIKYDNLGVTTNTITVCNEEGKPEPIKAAGEYQLFITAEALACGSDMDFYMNSDNLRFDYTVNAPIQNPEGVPFVITEPAYQTVEYVYYASLELDAESGFNSFIVNDEAGVYFTKDGEPFTTTNCRPSGRELQIDPVEYITTSGNYALVVKAGSISWTDGNESVSNTEDLVYNFTVVAPEPEGIPFFIDPEADSVLNELNTFTLSLDPESGYDAIDVDSYSVYILDGDMEPCGIVDATNDPSYKFVTLTVTDEDGNPITTPGQYTLAFEPWAVSCNAEDSYDKYYVNNEVLFFNYTVEAAPVKEPVEYDVIPSDYKPADGAEIDFNSADLATIIIYVEDGIAPAEGAMAYLTPLDSPEDYVEAPIKKNRMAGQLIIDFKPMQYNGEYELTIPEGSFGNEDWLENPQFGRTNPEITLYYTLINAYDRPVDIEYTLVPEISHSSDYKTFTLKFEEGTQMLPFARATFTNEEALYVKYAEFVDNGDSTFTVEFDEAPAVNGNYLFSVDRGEFGNAEYVESGAEKGVANEAVAVVFEVTTSGVDAIGADGAAKAVYNLQGIKVADSAKNLPAGVYIIDGKKVAVKK